jgi:catechol 2,3-dioxygenase-like lactoylglutathione lyase family enzyme
MTRGHVHHVDLTVKDAHASRAFYESVLGFMGYELGETYPIGYDFDLVEEPFCSIGIRSASGANAGRSHDRYSAGLHHLAWTAGSRADVDAMHEHLLQIGATILDAPAEYPAYGPGYYAVFFADPDGLKLEFVYKPHTQAGPRS